MGMILSARCERCGYHEEGLRLGTTHAALEEHDVEVRELFPVKCCDRVMSLPILLGMPLPRPECEACGAPLEILPSDRYSIARLSGDVLTGHPCPRCGEAESLSFSPEGGFR